MSTHCKRRRRAAGALAALALGAWIGGDSAAQTPLVYPTRNQSVAQQQRDETECRGWAAQRSGFDRGRPPPYGYYAGPPPGPPSGSGGLMDFGAGSGQFGDLVGDAARGAALGALGGAIAGDAGKGAAWGAFGGAIFGGLQRQTREQQRSEWEYRQYQQMQEQRYRWQQRYAYDQQRYNDAFGLCMEARGYSVRYW